MDMQIQDSGVVGATQGARATLRQQKPRGFESWIAALQSAEPS